MSRIKWSRILISRIEPIARLKSSRQKPAIQYVCMCVYVCMYVCNSCNIGMSDLPDMYAQSPRAAGPRAEGIHIRQITSAYVTTNM